MDSEQIGKMMTTYQEAKSKLSRLRAELAEHGDALIQLGKALQQAPHLIQLGGNSFGIDEDAFMVDPKAWITPAALGARVAEARRLHQDIERLEPEVKKFTS